MGKLSNLVNVKVLQSEKTLDKRKLLVEIEAPIGLFLLSDTLFREGALKSLEARVRSASKEAVAGYIMSGREFVKRAAPGKVRRENVRRSDAGQDKSNDTKFT